MRRISLIAASLLVALSACTQHTGGGRARQPAPPPPPPREQVTFAPLAGVHDDGGDQAIHSLAARGSTVVAVGADDGGGLSRPVFLRSTDAGRTWQRGVVRVGQPDVRTVGDWAALVVDYRGTFVVLGAASELFAEWTSRDGLTWTQRRLDRHAFLPHDTIGGFVATDQGLVVIGSTAPQGHDQVPIAWTSHDGVTWTRHADQLRRLGVPGSDVEPHGVAADGGVLVAVGEVNDEDAGDDPQVAAIWRSTDGGATWSRVSLPRHFAGTGRSYFTEVTRVGGAFVAVGAGGDASNNEWAGVVARSVDGEHWSGEYSGAPLAEVRSIYLGAIAELDGTIVAAGDARAGATHAFAVFGEPGAGWARGTIPPEAGATSSWASAAVGVPGAVLLGGDANPHGSRDARIWRTTDGRSFVPVDVSAAVAPRPVVTVADVTYGEGRYVAVGSSAGVPVAWTSTDGLHYGAPVALSRAAHDSVGSIAHGRAGWLAVGAHDIGSNGQAVVWSSSDGIHWRRLADGTLGDAGPFRSSEIAHAVGYRDDWVLVGSHFENRVTSAQSYRGTPSGWNFGSAAHPAPDPEPDDLRGDEQSSRWMSDVTTCGAGLIAVGGADDHRLAHPAVWRSPDGVGWELTRLPLPAGMYVADIGRVTATGKRVVAVGTATPSQGRARLHAYAWASGDAGRHWAAHALPERAGWTGNTTPAVVRGDASRYVVVGAAGPYGRQSTVAWASADGAHWRELALTDGELRGPGQRIPNGAIVVRDRLVGVATVVSVGATGPIAFSEQLR